MQRAKLTSQLYAVQAAMSKEYAAKEYAQQAKEYVAKQARDLAEMEKVRALEKMQQHAAASVHAANGSSSPSNLTIDTLFYLFHNGGTEPHQHAAIAAELYNRHWKFHPTKRLWFFNNCHTLPPEARNAKPSWMYWDPAKFERIYCFLFILSYSM